MPSLAGGGAERITLVLASGLLDRGHQVDLLLRDLVCDYPKYVPERARVFFLRRSDDAVGHADFEDLPVRPRSLIPASLPASLRFPRLALSLVVSRRQWPLLASTRLPRWAAATAAYLDRERPNSLLAMLTPAVAAATLAANLANHQPRIVASLHNAFRSKREILRARASYPFADAAVGVSAGVSSDLSRLPGMSPDRIHTIYNPVVSADLSRQASEPVHHPWFEESGNPVVLAIGRLHKQKDFFTLLAAFAILLQWRVARLIVLGTGPLLPQLRSRADELGIGERVEFSGFVENPYAFLARADLFVLSSRHEGLANVLIEAMACGCPVVSTDCPFGPDEILEGGRWGELVPVGDPDALASAMSRALDEPRRREVLRDRARFFNVDHAVSRYEEILFEQ